jgi:2-C-methyl-D-erythritol 4-phosphate cytidylyltransferase
MQGQACSPLAVYTAGVFVSALVVAGGRGTRMGQSVNKTLLLLDGRPIIWHTVARLREVDAIGEVLVLVNQADHDLHTGRWRDELATLGVERVLIGGARRQDTVFEGVRNCRAGVDDIVLVHDGVRPFARRTLIERVIERTAACGAAIAALPVDATIKACDEGQIRRTVPRDGLWLAQTPQGFRKGLLAAALDYARMESLEVTDDAALLEAQGHAVEVVPGNRANFKITTPDDLELARQLVSSQR